MARFTSEQTAEISKAIDRAVKRAVGRFPALRACAADMAQDAWVKVLAGYDPTVGTVGALAYTVASTIAIDYARNRGAKLRMRDLDASLDAPVGADDEQTTALVDTLASATLDPATMAHATVRAAAVQAALATVGDAGRDAIEAWLAGDTMTGAQRIAKKRALDALQDQISTAL